jgi:hypothetical protein
MKQSSETNILNQIKLNPNGEKLLRSFYQIISDLDLCPITQHINDLSQKCSKYYSNINFSNDNIRNVKLFADSLQNVVDCVLKENPNDKNLNVRTSKWTILGISLKILSNLSSFQNGSSIEILISNFHCIYQLIRTIRDKFINSNIENGEYLIKLAVINNLFQNLEAIFINSLLMIDSNEHKLINLNENLSFCVKILNDFSNFHQLYQIIFFKNFILPKIYVKIGEIVDKFDVYFLHKINNQDYLSYFKANFNKLLILIFSKQI